MAELRVKNHILKVETNKKYKTIDYFMARGYAISIVKN